MTDKPIFLFNCLYPRYKMRNYAGATFSPWGVSPTINTQGGGNRQPYILTYDKTAKDTIQMEGGRLDTRLRQREEHQHLGVADMVNESRGAHHAGASDYPPLILTDDEREKTRLRSAAPPSDVADGIRHNEAHGPDARQYLPDDNDLPMGAQQRGDNL